MGGVRIDALATLGEDVGSHVLSLLDPASLPRCTCVSTQWRAAASDDCLWRPLVERRWAGQPYVHSRVRNPAVPRMLAYKCHPLAAEQAQLAAYMEMCLERTKDELQMFNALQAIVERELLLLRDGPPPPPPGGGVTCKALDRWRGCLADSTDHLGLLYKRLCFFSTKLACLEVEGKALRSTGALQRLARFGARR